MEFCLIFFLEFVELVEPCGGSSDGAIRRRTHSPKFQKNRMCFVILLLNIPRDSN